MWRVLLLTLGFSSNGNTLTLKVGFFLKSSIHFMKTYTQKGNNALLILNHKTSSKVSLKSVILIKGDINYTKFYLECGRERTVAHSIKFFEPHLETQGFLRVHRAFMVNPKHVKLYNPLEESLTMSNGHIAVISRRKKHVLNWRNLDN